MDKIWIYREPDPKLVNALLAEYDMLEIIARIMVNRGLTSMNEARHFFNPNLKRLYDPFLMQDMEAAVDRIRRALLERERIMIFGDYDVDGTTATALLYLFFNEMGVKTFYYIPEREGEGYGISRKGIDFALNQGVSLLISCDCGINAFDEVKYAQSKGIDVIITDHHEPARDLPSALAILDPKRADCPYPFKELCGAGVAFKLIQAVSQKLEIPEDKFHKHLDLVAIGTAADIVPILDENRIIVARGLDLLNNPGKAGISALLRIAGYENKELSVSDIVFGLAPRLNAAGRIGKGDRSVKLLTSYDFADAAYFSEVLDSENKLRQSIERETLDDAILTLNAKYAHSPGKAIILYKENWHIGVIGIVASKLKELYHRPVFMISIQDGVGKGSGRSISGFDLYSALSRCSDLLMGFGGHKTAAGLTINPDKLPEFEERFLQIAREEISDEMLKQRIFIDGDIRLADINKQFLDFLRNLGPFGPGNMRPVLVTKQASVYGQSRIVGENHLKFKVRQGRMVYDAIGWNLADDFEKTISNRALDIAFVLEENEWNGQKNLQLNVKDIQYSK